jgi:hypothetical protein
MRVRVHVIELTPRAKRGAVVVGAFVILAATALPADASPPALFSPGQTLSSSVMNQNFSGLDSRIGALESFTSTGTKVVETRNGKKWSLGATYCGATGTSYTGASVGGYASAKSLCEQVSLGCNQSTSAHMCTAEEVLRTYEMGLPFSTTGWYSQGAWSYSPAQPVYVNDCAAWTSSSATTDIGPVWNNNGPQPSGDHCNGSHPILCCD